MFSFSCHSLLVCVGRMEHSDSDSDFELQEVHLGLDGLSDENSDTFSEEPYSAVGVLVEMMSRVAMKLTVAQGGINFGKRAIKPRGI